jgi:hypothetical protein
MQRFHPRTRRPQRRPMRERVQRHLEQPESLFVMVALAVALWLAFLASQAAIAGAATSKIGPPHQLSPDDGVVVQAVPAFSWRAVRHASKYEFQLSADPAFESIVLGQGNGSFFTHNTYASINKALANGSYYWRVRAIDARDRAGRWSDVRSVIKRWTATPVLLGPPADTAVSYPRTPLILRWAPVPGAYKYLLRITTDPALSNSVFGSRLPAVETSGTVFAMPLALAPGRYYWGVAPVDGQGHTGALSRVSSFLWSWPTRTTARVTDIDPDPRVMDPQFSWDPVPGAARYEVEVNPSADFAVGSRVCCNEPVVGTTHSPLRLLPNNTYFWRVRAIDLDGNAGVWNVGPSFKKDFDDVSPSVVNLHVRDNLSDSTPATDAQGLPETDAPVLSWSPVHGASSYEVNVAPYTGFCNWTPNRSLGEPPAKTSLTAATSWTPLGGSTAGRPVGNAFTTISSDGSWRLADGVSYCVRVRARSDRDAFGKEIVSEWTQLGGIGNAAFTYHAHQMVGSCAPETMPAGAYHEPQVGTVSRRMPLFTWDWVGNACSYFVVVARDAEFTKIVDVAITRQPAYAPRRGSVPTTYSDETTTYYWAVMPARDANGGGLSTQPIEDHPRAFQKRSVPPTLLSPQPGAAVPTQPVFRWTAAEGARQYRIQIAHDPTFGSPIADVLTNATAYTSTSALPPDSVLYWRVRANDENRVGLTWSSTGTFRRRLPTPVVARNPLGGEVIPVLSWSPVNGAVSYSMHVEQVDGTKRDFTMRSTAFTPIVFYGTGVWHWQVRANFQAGSRVVSGGYFAPQPFTRRIATPANLRATKANRGALLSWDPALMAKRYRVQIGTTDSFSHVIEQAITDNPSWAPRMLNRAFAGRGGLYWRVAVMDEGNNLGGWATRPLRTLRAAHIRVRGRLRAGLAGAVRVTVTGRGGRPLKGAVVRVRGAGIVARPRHTDRRGRLRLRLKPHTTGTARFSADKTGYRPARARLRVRGPGV